MKYMIQVLSLSLLFSSAFLYAEDTTVKPELKCPHEKCECADKADCPKCDQCKEKECPKKKKGTCPRMKKSK